ncbi:MAG: universal stress protein [Steroidobacteraceae bacterium]
MRVATHGRSQKPGGGIEMFRNMIVGVDGKEGGRDAISLARLLLDADGELTLACIHYGDAHLWRGYSAAYEAAEHERAREVLEREREAAGIDVQVRSKGSPSVGQGLHELAEDIGADLLVLGSSRRGVLGRVLIGDDTHAALNGAPCPVAVAPAGFAERPAAIHEIGVGYNGSPESEHALGFARRLAGEHDAKLSAFEAISLPTYVFMGPTIPDYAAIGEIVDAAREQVRELGGVEPHAAYGPAAEELATYSDSLDLLVVGSRGYGPIGRLVHGSTSRHLARTARCPLLVLTRSADAGDGLDEEPQAAG